MKIIIGVIIAMIIVFIFTLIFLSGATYTNVPTTENLSQVITGVTCEDSDENRTDYDISILTNNTQFENEILSKNYSKITIEHSQSFESLGLAFIIRTNEKTSLEISLMKNDEVLKTTTLEFETGVSQSVNLLLNEANSVSLTDNFYIKISQQQDTTFRFDTMVFYFDEA
jgi:hypothetical protein